MALGSVASRADSAAASLRLCREDFCARAWRAAKRAWRDWRGSDDAGAGAGAGEFEDGGGEVER